MPNTSRERRRVIGGWVALLARRVGGGSTGTVHTHSFRAGAVDGDRLVFDSADTPTPSALSAAESRPAPDGYSEAVGMPTSANSVANSSDSPGSVDVATNIRKAHCWASHVQELVGFLVVTWVTKNREIARYASSFGVV